MRIKVDEENDTLYFRLNEAAVVESEEVQPGVILDFDADRNLVGVEILGLSKRVPPGKLKTFQYETA